MSSLLKENCIVFDIDAENKGEVIHRLVEQLKAAGKIVDADKFFEDVLAREAISPTCIGFDLGMPHGKTDNVLEAGICFGRLTTPVVWDDDSRETVNMVILIAVPDQEAGNTHLEILASLSRSLMHESFRNDLSGSNKEEVFGILTKALEG